MRQFALGLALAAFAWVPLHAVEPIVVRFGFPTTFPRVAEAANFEPTNAELGGVGRVVVVEQSGDSLAALRRGEIDLAVIPTGRLAETKAKGFAIFGIPFLFNGVKDAAGLQRGALGEAALASLSNEALVGLGYWNAGTQRILGSRPTSLETFKGLKIRAVSSKQLQTSLSELGALPVQLPFGAVYTALQTGALDATEASPFTTLQNRLYETKKVLTDQTLVVQAYVVVASQKSWNGFPYSVQSALAKKVRKTADALAVAVPEFESSLTSQLKERGLQLVSMTPESLKGARDFAYSSYERRPTDQDDLAKLSVAALRQESAQPLPHNQPLIDPTPPPTGKLDLFFATDRRAEPASNSITQFGSQRGDLTYGSLQISLGSGPAAAGPSDATRITALSPLANAQDFAAALTQAIKAAPSKELFIYVHGYNTTFEYAVESTAMLLQDLKFKGVGLVFSWPSDGTALQYPRDEQEQEVSHLSLENVLRVVRQIAGVQRVHLLAHSMGGRVITGSLELIARDPNAKAFLDNLILAAPDVYVARFGQTLGSMTRLSKRVTLYASSADQALICSALLHDGARAGQAGDARVIAAKVDTVDTSNAETKSFAQKIASYTPAPLNMLYFLVFDSCRAGHSYITRNFLVLNDLYSLVLSNMPPEDRVLLEKRLVQPLWYWEMRQAAR